MQERISNFKMCIFNLKRFYKIIKNKIFLDIKYRDHRLSKKQNLVANLICKNVLNKWIIKTVNKICKSNK